MAETRETGPVALFAVATLLATTLIPGSALAHADGELSGGFLTGFAHPILGWDHVAAMVAVGLWGAFLGSPGIWILPVVFPLVMALGAAAGVLGMPLPGVEVGIAGSAVVLGLLILLAVKPPLWVAATIVGAFAVFHGYAHGTELPDATNGFGFGVGFVLATGLLHMLGIAFGFLVRVPGGATAVRGGGAVISLAGVGFLLGFI